MIFPARVLIMSSVNKLLSTIVKSLFPQNSGLVSAFGYGSVAIPQHDRSTAHSQLDLVLIVEDPYNWHVANCNRNPHHYNKLARRFDKFLLKRAVTHMPNPAVYYNPFVTWHDPSSQFPSQLIKYGVVGIKPLLEDLSTWSDLYIAGRLHKPVAWISSIGTKPKELANGLQSNLKAAAAFALLQNPLGEINEHAFYHSIASISYQGDWRVYFGEDRRKIDRLISGEPRRRSFRELYLPTLFAIDLLPANVPRDVNTDFQIEISNLSVPNLLACLPASLCRIATKMTEPKMARDLLARMPQSERSMHLSKAAASVVRWASYRQTLLGVFSAGLTKSAQYSFAKFRKMLVSL